MKTPAVPRETPFIVIRPKAYPTAEIANTLKIRNVIPVTGITPQNKDI